ncbi:MAG: hypothetical protein H6668_01590 [Ardenticatenaceae bacterium]|nr:hypothetical protein [Ardenticatenaceae bacterium]
MPKQQFALEKEGQKRLELSWGMGWRNFTVRLDGAEVGEIEGGQKSLKEGRSFALNDGSTLLIQLKTGLMAELQVLRDGKPLPGSSTDPRQRLNNASGLIMGLGGMSIVVGILAMFWPVLQEAGFSWDSTVFGILLLGLGYWARQESLLAIWLAIIIFVLGSILTILATNSFVGSNAGGIVLRILFTIFMYRGVGAIKELQAEGV